jgi:hypothetical protein
MRLLFPYGGELGGLSTMILDCLNTMQCRVDDKDTRTACIILSKILLRVAISSSPCCDCDGSWEPVVSSSEEAAAAGGDGGGGGGGARSGGLNFLCLVTSGPSTDFLGGIDADE